MKTMISLMACTLLAQQTPPGPNVEQAEREGALLNAPQCLPIRKSAGSDPR